jgi:hypothetical protein
MSQFNEEISVFAHRDGGPSGGANPRYMLAKRFINGNINKVNCSTTFGDPTQCVLNRLREMAFRTAVAAAAVSDSALLSENAQLAQQHSSRAQNWTQNVDVTG